MNIFVYIQQDKGEINSVSLEALQGAQEIAKKCNGSVTAITFNANTSNTLASYDLNEIVLIEDPQLEEYNPLFYVKALYDILNEKQFDIIVFGHTYEARDWVPRLSARLDIPFISDCINFNSGPKLTFTRSIYQGKLNSEVSSNNDKYIISFQSGAFKADQINLGNSKIQNISVDLSSVSDIIQPGEKFQESESSVDLSQAEVIVSIGRGIGKEENLPIAKQLATALKAELASSRPVVDSGWLEAYHQVGSSGQSVSPKLYFALGISGAIQHVVGMKGSKTILVINKDSDAPIFEIADYGVVGDIFEIIPVLTEKLNNL